MSAWGTGVFENDGSADFLSELQDTGLEQRESVISEALQAAAEGEDFLAFPVGQDAIAAAGVMAAARAGQPITEPDCGVDLAAADLPPATPELITLAVQALDRVTGENSEWREMWGQTNALAEVLSAVAEVRAALT